MSTSTQNDIKGRVMEATGILTGNDELKRERKIDQLSSKIKEVTEKVADKVKDITSSDDDKHR
ncbi:MAG: CsbD family protein [Candidatus Competibacteraceae bacterium]|nr:CsbD family protein [Candidatus Competibacteraceae bacterium]